MDMMTRNRWVVAGLALAVGASAMACGGDAPKDTPATGDPIAVTLARAELTTVADAVEVGGTITAADTAIVAARIMAPILRVTVQPGDRVRKGQTLVELDSADSQANVTRATAGVAAATAAARAATSDLAAAEAGLSLAQATQTRIAGLAAQRSATTQELDQATSALRQAEASVSAARAQIDAATKAAEAAEAGVSAASIARSWTVLVSPFDGIVAARHADAGTMATPGQPLLVIEAPSRLEMQVRVDATRASRVSLGDRASVRLDGADAWIDATVTEMARVDPQSHSFVVTLAPARDAAVSTWRSGLFGRARFVGETRERLTIPTGAVVQRGQLTLVYLLSADGQARLRVVSVGASHEGRVEVLAGVSVGDRVVVDPPAALTDGQKVRS
jgi:RND family efflux transporter MFP subunit